MLKTRKQVHEPVVKLPALPYEQFLGLRDHIAVNGVLVLVPANGDRRKATEPPAIIAAFCNRGKYLLLNPCPSCSRGTFWRSSPRHQR